ncbi:hypothetical protein ERX27_07315 [Macrococcus brunensis]|uniref:Colicin D immunity protein domain-containing protein n=1 Tax=Macrococcus brunensis TaxID=198483 RepID=A0A4V3BDE1_9STAP|nr:hypothetical protein [Macrococcus brunensis]TDL96655.1 hypothetical protein ERX27_07315 [Macrococcus brunensis]
MSHSAILLRILKDLVEGRISTKIFVDYYYDIYNFMADEDDFTLYQAALFKELDDLVTFYIAPDEVPEYPYLNDDIKVLSEAKEILKRLEEEYQY